MTLTVALWLSLSLSLCTFSIGKLFYSLLFMYTFLTVQQNSNVTQWFQQRDTRHWAHAAYTWTLSTMLAVWHWHAAGKVAEKCNAMEWHISHDNEFLHLKKWQLHTWVSVVKLWMQFARKYALNCRNYYARAICIRHPPKQFNMTIISCNGHTI